MGNSEKLQKLFDRLGLGEDVLLTDPRILAAEIAYLVVVIEKNVTHGDILAGINRLISHPDEYFTRGIAFGIAMILASEEKSS